MAIFSSRGDVQTMLALAPMLQDPGPDTRCGEYFRANDVDLSKYDSVANARDAIGLLQALDYPAYNIYGISYGTRLATVVMRLYEESPDAAALPSIRSVVIDGVMPTTINQAGENPVSEELWRCASLPTVKPTQPVTRHSPISASVRSTCSTSLALRRLRPAPGQR